MTMLEHREASQLKADMRRVMRSRLRGLSPAHRQRKSVAACRSLIGTQAFQEARVVMVYLSMAYEADTAQIIQEAWRQKKAVAVPKVRGDEDVMLAVRLNSLADRFSEEVAGLRNPVSEDQVPVDEIDLVVVPLLAIDGLGNRLGQGGGCYDRFFASAGLGARRCGLAFHEQRVDRVPTVETDQPLDMLVTDTEIRYIGSSR